MEKRMYMEQLIADFNGIKKISGQAYEAVYQKLSLHKVSRGQVLKKMDTVEEASRYICEGYLGLFKEEKDDKKKGKSDLKRGKDGLKLFRLFGPSDVAFDDQSFRTTTPSKRELRALSDGVLLELKLKAEIELFSLSPEFYGLALEVAHRINRRNIQQQAIKDKKFWDGFPLLLRKYPGIGQHLRNGDLADFCNCSISTVERLKFSIMNEHEDKR